MLKTSVVVFIIAATVQVSESCLRLTYSTQRVTVPMEGTYVLALTLDPQPYDVRVDIMLNDYRWLATGYGRDFAITGLDVAIPLKATDFLALHFSDAYGPFQSLTGVLVNNNDSYFLTVWCKGYSGGVGLVPFHGELTAGQGFRDLPSPRLTFTAPTTGVYWVSLRADCEGGGWAEVGFDPDNLFTTLCRDAAAVTASGAHFFNAAEQIKVKYLRGNTGLGPMTVLSFSLLEGNKELATYIYPRVGNVTTKRAVYTYSAYTGYLASTIVPEGNPKLNFGGKTSCKLGFVWDWGYWTITPDGVGIFLVSVRAWPVGFSDVVLDLYKYDRSFQHSTLVHTFWSERGYASGQTVAIYLEYNELYVRVRGGTKLLGANTMLSAALVMRADSPYAKYVKGSPRPSDLLPIISPYDTS